VKRLTLSYDNPDLAIRQFRNEFDKLVMLKHQNVVQIFGYCFETEKTSKYRNGMKITVENIHIALCLEYLHNGSLQKHLSGMQLHHLWYVMKGNCHVYMYFDY
jgi:serine/threonine protein kinase